MTRTIADRIRQSADRGFVGREEEVTALTSRREPARAADRAILAISYDRA